MYQPVMHTQKSYYKIGEMLKIRRKNFSESH